MFYLKILLVCLLQFVFLKCYNNFFIFNIIDNICTWNCIFNFSNYKSFFRLICSISLSEFILHFDIQTWSSTRNLWYLSLIFLPKSVYAISLTSKGFALIFLWYYCCIHLLYHLMYQFTHLLKLKPCFCWF